MWGISINEEKKLLSEISLEDVPSDKACIVSNGTIDSLRIVKVPSIHRLIIWDMNDKKRTFSFFLSEAQDEFAAVIQDVLRFWRLL